MDLLSGHPDRDALRDRMADQGREDIARMDADTLERAARVLKLRSRRPRSFLLAVLCNMLNDAARKIRDEAAR